jgi:hypothetical protein
MSRFGSIEKRYGVDEPGYHPPVDEPVRIPDEDTRRQYFDVANRTSRDQKLGLLVLDADGKRLLKPKETYPLAGAKATVETGWTDRKAGHSHARARSRSLCARCTQEA